MYLVVSYTVTVCLWQIDFSMTPVANDNHWRITVYLWSRSFGYPSLKKDSSLPFFIKNLLLGLSSSICLKRLLNISKRGLTPLIFTFSPFGLPSWKNLDPPLFNQNYAWSIEPLRSKIELVWRRVWPSSYWIPPFAYPPLKSKSLILP